MIELPYVLRHENICRLEGNRLLIGDRRVFPFEKRFEVCANVQEVARSLQTMVTQGGGPLEVALQTMILVTNQMQQGLLGHGFETLTDAAKLLIAARPTNTTMHRALGLLLAAVQPKQADLEELTSALKQEVSSMLDGYDQLYHQMGRLGSSLIADRSVILTTCFAEHTFLLSLAYAKESGKEVRVLANETRPYLQGSRLTAVSLEEMDIEVNVITDGMGATFMEAGKVDAYMTAVDLLCMDGTVVNKVGTLANAIAARYASVPYYAFSISPDPSKQGRADVTMEMRPPQEVKRCMGSATTLDSIKALYPAFDSIPAQLVTALVTPKGILKPEEIQRNFS